MHKEISFDSQVLYRGDYNLLREGQVDRGVRAESVRATRLVGEVNNFRFNQSPLLVDKDRHSLLTSEDCLHDKRFVPSREVG